MSKTWVDPEQGWRYGFPKLWDTEEHETLEAFLKANGWPEGDETSFHYVRMWEDTP